MTRIADADLAELAFAVANGEALSADKADLARRIRLSHGDAARSLDEHLRVIDVLKSAPEREDLPRTADCLDDAGIAGYLDGTLDAKARASAEEHLGRCDRCLGELGELAETLAELRKEGVYCDPEDAKGPAPSVLFEYVVGIARAARGVARGLRLLAHPEEGFLFVEPQPVPVLGAAAPRVLDASFVPARGGNRGDEAAAQGTCAWTQFFSEYELAFSLVQLDDGRVNVRLTLAGPSGPASGARLTIRREGRILQSECFPEVGRLSLLNLDAGTYECQLHLPSGQQAGFSLDLKEMA